ncbi:MAG TPA: TIGR01906 family membrane protein, partial [Anaerolineales bacterium]
DYPRSLPLLSYLVTLLVPVALVLTIVIAGGGLLGRQFLQFEYNAPGFPVDSFGFTKEDRLYWSNITFNYLINSADVSYLGDLRFQNGQPVYNERELGHMVDVKRTLQGTFVAWIGSLVLILVIGGWLWGTGYSEDFRGGLRRGGWLTVILLVFVLLLVLFGFEIFFVAFHGVFFSPGTWMFEFSDTLIRLFPERLWRDIFTLIGSLALGGALALIFLFRKR